MRASKLNLPVVVLLGVSAAACRPIVKSVPVANATPVAMKQPGVHYCLPRRLVNLTIKRGVDVPAGQQAPPKGGLVDEVEVKLLPAVADPKACYVARLSHSWTSTDDIQLATTARGVLAGVNVASDDKTGDIVVTLAKTFVTIASLVASPPTAVMGLIGLEAVPKAAEKPCTPPTRAQYQFVFDPARAGEAGRVTDELRQACLPYVLTLDPEGTEDGTVVTDATSLSAKGGEYDGLLFRRPLSYRIRLDRRSDDGNGPVLETTAELPNGGAVVQARIDGSLLVRTSYSAKFEDGVLTEVKAVKPSEGLAWASLPLSILGVVAGPVGNFFRIDVKYDSKHEDVVGAQRVVIQQQAEQVRAATAAKAGAQSTEAPKAKVPVE